MKMDSIIVYGAPAIQELLDAGFTPLSRGTTPRIVTSYRHKHSDIKSGIREFFPYTDAIINFIMRDSVRADDYR